jgi:tetratricopeptide (TPR) repeat protein
MQRRLVRRQREALRLNALGAQLRREGVYREAADQHRAALAIFREIGDQRAEALTLNNLALALSRSGEEEAAVELFEESAAILHALGDQQHEGQVIANLGLAYRHHGRSDQSADALKAALTKLNPGSTAYFKIEQELRRVKLTVASVVPPSPKNLESSRTVLWSFGSPARGRRGCSTPEPRLYER